MHPHIGTKLRLKKNKRVIDVETGKSRSCSSKCAQRPRVPRHNLLRKQSQLNTDDFYRHIRAIWKNIPDIRSLTCLCVDSMYFSFYRKDKHKASVSRWMLDRDCFNKRYVFVPICETNHWHLLIFCNMGEDFNSKATKPCIIHIDSLQSREVSFEKEAREFFSDVYKAWKPQASEEDIYNIPFLTPKVPQQKDGTRCGYYVLCYIYRFIMDSPLQYKYETDYPGCLTEDWFSINEFEDFYKMCASISKELYDEELGVKDDNVIMNVVADIEKEDQRELDDENFGVKDDNVIMHVVADIEDEDQRTGNALMKSEADVGKSCEVEEKDSMLHDEENEVDVINLSSKMKHIGVTKKDSVLDKFIDLVSAEKSIPAENKGSESNEQRQIVCYEPKTSEEKKKRVLRIKIIPSVVRRSPRLVKESETSNEDSQTVQKKRKRKAAANIPVDSATTRLARSRSNKGKDTRVEEYVELINSSCEEIEIDCQAQNISKIKRKQKEVQTKRKKRKMPEKTNDKKAKKKVHEDSEVSEEVEENTESVIITMPRKLLLRAHPSNFTRTIQRLSNVQKKWIQSIGFGDLLSFSMIQIPNEIAKNVVWFYNPYDNVLNVNGKVIKITEDDVENVLGFPKGSREVVLAPSGSEDINRWRSQFSDAKGPHKVTEVMVSNAITNTRGVTREFKENFMVLVYNLFIRCLKNSFVCQDIVSFVGSFDQAKEFNWCKPVIQGLIRASEAWLKDPQKQYYTGPLMFLIYFYLSRVENEFIKCDRTTPAFLGWKNSVILQRDATEKVDDSFGKGKIYGNYEIQKDSQQSDDEDDYPVGKTVEDGIAETDNSADKADKLEQAKATNVSKENGIEYTEKDLGESDKYHTPTETLKGVCTDDYFLDEEVLLSKIKSEIEQIEVIQKRCSEHITMAKAFYCTNPTIERLERDFKRITHQTTEGSFPIQRERPSTSLPDMSSKSFEMEVDWCKLTNEDWNTIDVLGRPKSERPFLKMQNLAFFLGELTLEGRNIELDFDSVDPRHVTRVSKLNIEERPRRELKMGDVKKSPFHDREIDIDKKNLSRAEEQIWTWLNNSDKDPMEMIFIWKEYNPCIMADFRTLLFGKDLASSVLDAYTCILNDDEKYRSSDSPRRFFCNIYTTMGTLADYNKFQSPNEIEKNYTRFSGKMDAILKINSADLNNIDMVFFPIHSGDHYYVISFNIKNPLIEILDNNSLGEANIGIYDGLPESLKYNFVRYMETVSAKKSAQLHNAEISRIQMKWRTENNKTDCGIFALRHMETYKKTSLRDWNSKLATETEKNGQAQQRQLQRARQLYAFKIISSPINGMRLKIQEEIDRDMKVVQ